MKTALAALIFVVGASSATAQQYAANTGLHHLPTI